MEYKHTNINKKLKKTCNECGEIYESETCECMSGKMSESKKECNECGNMYEGETCECSNKMYTMEEIHRNVKFKNKANLVSNQINESLAWFKKII